MTPAGTVTLLFTDLVSSSELLQRAGDEAAQRVFQAHHRVLRDAVTANGGHEVKWLGDGLMVAFPSAADAVRCAIAMQQRTRRPAAGGALRRRPPPAAARYLPRRRAGPEHPLADALGDLRRQTTYERLYFKGLNAREVGQLLETLADQDVPQTLVTAISTETSGNPFFIREVLLHLVEEGKIFRQEGRWTSDLAIGEIGIPERVRQVIGRRLSRLSVEANQLLGVAAAFNGIFRFAIASAVAGLDEARGLRAIDEALAAQLLRPGGEADSYDFTHALIRHTLCAELSPSRQVRLHRQIAEAMERIHGNRVSEHAAEVAYQYARSAALPGSERGAPHAIAAADRAEAAYAHDDAATFLRIALELLPEGDTRRPRLLGRLGLALTWALDFEDALEVARQAGACIAGAEGDDAAADYLAEAVSAMMRAGFMRGWALAAPGLRYAGERRDSTWASLMHPEIFAGRRKTPTIPGSRSRHRSSANWIPCSSAIPWTSAGGDG